MVKGLEIFRDHFAAFLDSYVIIGGTACDLAFMSVGQEFRATEDLDIVLVTENMTSDFAAAFWEFVVAGDYKHRRKGEDDEVQFYRFIEPRIPDYPKQLELFSRKSDRLTSVATGTLTRVPIGEEGSSLSAILLDEDYYSLIREQRTESEGVSCLPPVALIPLKAAAWLDLTRRKAEGGRVDSRDIRKHKADVFRLFTLLTGDTRLAVPPKIQASLIDFIDEMRRVPPNLRDLGVRGVSADEIFTTLARIYEL